MTADPLSLVLLGYGAMVLFMLALWTLQLRVRNASIADVGFCIGLIAVVLWYAGQASGETERKLLVMLMTCVYAGRLGFFILVARVLGKAEDARYRELRRSWGTQERWWMFGYFQLQAAAVAAFSLPFLVVIQNPRPPFGLAELAGVLIWAGAVTGEAVADWQLSRFRARPWNRDRVCREGLWYLSRHPNYFFEWLHWWAYVVMALGAPYGIYTIVCPLLMLFFLTKVSGITYTEAQMLKSKGDAFLKYQRSTSSFIPLPKLKP